MARLGCGTRVVISFHGTLIIPVDSDGENSIIASKARHAIMAGTSRLSEE